MTDKEDDNTIFILEIKIDHLESEIEVLKRENSKLRKKLGIPSTMRYSKQKIISKL